MAIEPPFVGRTEELRLLKELLHATGREGKARVVSVTGIGGIGKSRLSWELLKYVDGLTETIWWHHGRCPSYGDGITFWALGEMVRMRAGIAETDAPGRLAIEARRVGGRARPRRGRAPVDRAAARVPARPRGASDRRRRRAVRRVAHVLRADQRRGHGRDGVRGPAVGRRRAARLHRVAAGVVARPPDLHRHAGPSRARRPASDTGAPAAGASCRCTSSRSPTRRWPSWCAAWCPAPTTPPSTASSSAPRACRSYAVETIRMLADRGVLRAGDDAYELVGDLGELEVPETLHALIASRLDALEPEDRALLQDAADPRQELHARGPRRRSTGRAADDARAAAARPQSRKEFLVHEADPRSPERGQYAFVQGIIREIAYGMLSKADRRARHLAVAHHFEAAGDDELAGVVAAHYVEALRATPDGPDRDALSARARDWLAQAAERARCARLARPGARRSASRHSRSPPPARSGPRSCRVPPAPRTTRSSPTEQVDYLREAADDPRRPRRRRCRDGRPGAARHRPRRPGPASTSSGRWSSRCERQLDATTDALARAEYDHAVGYVLYFDGDLDGCWRPRPALAGYEEAAGLGPVPQGAAQPRRAADVARPVPRGDHPASRHAGDRHRGERPAHGRSGPDRACRSRPTSGPRRCSHSLEAAALARRGGCGGPEMIALANAVEFAVETGTGHGRRAARRPAVPAGPARSPGRRGRARRGAAGRLPRGPRRGPAALDRVSAQVDGVTQPHDRRLVPAGPLGAPAHRPATSTGAFDEAIAAIDAEAGIGTNSTVAAAFAGHAALWLRDPAGPGRPWTGCPWRTSAGTSPSAGHWRRGWTRSRAAPRAPPPSTTRPGRPPRRRRPVHACPDHAGRRGRPARGPGPRRRTGDRPRIPGGSRRHTAAGPAVGCGRPQLRAPRRSADAASEHVERGVKGRVSLCRRHLAQRAVHVELGVAVDGRPAGHVGALPAFGVRRARRRPARRARRSGRRRARPGSRRRARRASPAVGERDLEQAGLARSRSRRTRGRSRAAARRRRAAGSSIVTASIRVAHRLLELGHRAATRPRRAARRGRRSAGTPRCATRPVRRATSRSTTPSGPLARASSAAASTRAGRRLPWWYGCVDGHGSSIVRC